MKPLVSVIVPVYKVEKYLDKCVESIVNQTYENLEIILVDDGSPDNCPRMCDEWSLRDGRINVVHKENGGVGDARNCGINSCKGEFIMFVDPDDYLNINAVKILIDRMVADKSDMAVGNMLRVDEEGVILGEIYTTVEDACVTPENIVNSQEGLNKIPCMACGKLYKRKIFEKLRFTNITCGEDLWIFYDTTFGCELISLCNPVIYYYTQRMSSAVHTLSDSAIYESICAALHICEKLVNGGYWKSAKSYYSSAVHQAITMNNPLCARKMIVTKFSLYARFKLMKCDVHNVAWWLALYIPSIRYMIMKRHSIRKTV